MRLKSKNGRGVRKTKQIKLTPTHRREQSNFCSIEYCVMYHVVAMELSARIWGFGKDGMQAMGMVYMGMFCRTIGFRTDKWD